MRAPRFLIAIPILLTAVCLEAQWADRLYPFTELTDEMRARIDLKDGSIDDWLEVLGEPTVTPLDFVTSPWFSGYEPSSYDFRVWLAWHDATDRLFVAAEIVDDIHVITYERGNDGGMDLEAEIPPPQSLHYLLGPDASFEKDDFFLWSDTWAHGILLGADGRTDDSAVESVTWARIKASLSE